jgi:phosphocarrier protein
VYTKTATIRNKSGLHARPAADFVKEAVKFKSSVKVCKKGKPTAIVNAKSLVMVLSLSAACGEELEIRANGEDEAAAVDALVAAVEAGRGESE